MYTNNAFHRFRVPVVRGVLDFPLLDGLRFAALDTRPDDITGVFCCFFPIEALPSLGPSHSANNCAFNGVFAYTMMPQQLQIERAPKNQDSPRPGSVG